MLNVYMLHPHERVKQRGMHLIFLGWYFLTEERLMVECLTFTIGPLGGRGGRKRGGDWFPYRIRYLNPSAVGG